MDAARHDGVSDQPYIHHMRFNRFLEIEDINAKILSARLKENGKGWIDRKKGLR